MREGGVKQTAEGLTWPNTQWRVSGSWCNQLHQKQGPSFPALSLVRCRCLPTYLGLKLLLRAGIPAHFGSQIRKFCPASSSGRDPSSASAFMPMTLPCALGCSGHRYSAQELACIWDFKIWQEERNYDRNRRKRKLPSLSENLKICRRGMDVHPSVWTVQLTIRSPWLPDCPRWQTAGRMTQECEGLRHRGRAGGFSQGQQTQDTGEMSLSPSLT